uniref:ABC-type transporter Mla maintaining outer membrane lipid asymmetry, MlaC component n=1 Tax=Candidatus Kentrum sp. DK TaxID=2126562 RepID=A0A450RVN0_9GAMM|nr:MAG: ABC-type transporter Mla maintaining outer membrane lipid asymmetry, MlaC component [Candidatus Kentron sp. DK]VFJ57061.1 MAG: ABC-type transporter Mla maintaining outer membrane lipid asymmetry, MlaC component [Candidatus Kentron sp. DK]
MNYPTNQTAFPKAVTLILTLILMLPGLSVPAAPPDGTAPPRVSAPFSASIQTPDEVLREGIGKLLYFLEGIGTRTPSARLLPQLKTLLEQEVSRYFAFSYMARWAAGRKYRYLEEEQKQEVEAKIKDMLISAMLRHLADYKHTHIEYLPPRRNKMGGIVLGIQVTSEDAPPRHLEFHMFRAEQSMKEAGHKDWQIVDVSSDGQSALAYYRWYFSRNLP